MPAFLLVDALLLLLYLRHLNRRRSSVPHTETATKLWRTHTALRNPVRAEVSAGGLEMGSGDESTEYTWPDLRWVIETDRCLVIGIRAPKGAGVNLFSRFFFALGVTARIPVPKRAAGDPETLATLRSLISDGLGKRYFRTGAAVG